jgi:hypothetical protein
MDDEPGATTSQGRSTTQQTAIQGASSQTATTQSGSRSSDLVRSITEKCQQIVEQAAHGLIPRGQFIERIREAGATAEEASDYVEQLRQRRQIPQVTHHSMKIEPARTE